MKMLKDFNVYIATIFSILYMYLCNYNGFICNNAYLIK